MMLMKTVELISDIAAQIQNKNGLQRKKALELIRKKSKSVGVHESKMTLHHTLWLIRHFERIHIHQHNRTLFSD